ncbi:uncharacterized protein OCT59_025743 [Rhizophagus irregularis]|uniref:Uncharacterized protein n=1 Tax=Rhizophagus irregularis TaxID=588596 RepID=A0A915YPQ2_9GLOM|nr:hypothetical protein OCT59_025743 [Rhizophagus irregularis]CAB5204863.1 unnamed protein product [Rhizophagus irregularis]CAB5307371.1 unnamed protein product [Rhizophagus irregularis]
MYYASNEFFHSINFSPVPVKFLHDSKWKEVPSKQKQVVDNILLVLKEVWNNRTYSDHKFTKKLNEVELIVTTHIYRKLLVFVVRHKKRKMIT